MSINVLEDIKTVSELKKKTNEIFSQMHKTGRPIVVTVNGKPDAVMMDVEVYEKKLRAFNLAPLLAEAESGIEKSRTRSARDFLKEWFDESKVPG
jgi:prevent-host-death family protein